MKKNITINLCGRLFQIDEDAYELLQQYIESLRSSFGKQEGGEEIADDIEARIAELFDELRQKGIEAITIDHVKDIITRIGKPEELTGEDEKLDDDNKGHKYDSFRSAAQGICDNVRARTAGKRLYRNPNDKMLAGVLSGIATYTGSDATWWRIGYVLLFLCSNFFVFPILKLFHMGGFFFHINLAFILFYIVLAIAIPMPKTPKQVLEMEGKDVTPQNLADVVIEEKKPITHSVTHSFFSVILKLLAGLLFALFVIVGLVLLVCFLLIAGSLIVVFTVPGASHRSLPFDLGYLNLPEIYAAHPWVVITFIVSLLLAFITPLYAIVHGLLAKAGKVKPLSTWQNVAWVVVWLIAMAAFFPSLYTLEDLRQAERESQVVSGGSITPYSINNIPMMEQDFNYFSQNGWVMVKTSNTEENYATHTSKYEYYTGDSTVWYLNGHEWDKDQQRDYQAEHQEVWVEPGIYSLSCVVRADGKGAFVYVTCNGEKKFKEIPPYGFKGGELWMGTHLLPPSEARGSVEENHRKIAEILKNEPQWKRDEWQKIVKANHSRGFGWSIVQIDNIVVSADSIPVVYGVSTIPEFTGQPCHAKEFTATDFMLTRTGNLENVSQK